MITCTLATVENCNLQHPDCQHTGSCNGHVKKACDAPAVYELSGQNLQQYACADHIDLQLRHFRGATVRRMR